MKKAITLLLTILMVVSLAACGESKPIEPPTVPATQAPTDAPYIDTQVSEPEWTLAEGELTLVDGQTLYAKGENFLYFAIVGATPAEMELRFKLDDATATLMKAQSKELEYYINLNGERIGTATFNDDCTEAIITSQNAAQEITSLATKIRGLQEE